MLAQGGKYYLQVNMSDTVRLETVLCVICARGMRNRERAHSLRCSTPVVPPYCSGHTGRTSVARHYASKSDNHRIDPLQSNVLTIFDEGSVKTSVSTSSCGRHEQPQRDI